MKILRLFEDENGESDFDTVAINLNLQDDSPPAKPHHFSDAAPQR